MDIQNQNKREEPPSSIGLCGSLRALALSAIAGAWAISCSEQPDRATPSTIQIQDPDYLRWQNSLATKESEQAFKQYLSRGKPNSTGDRSPVLSFETPFTLDIALDSMLRAEKLTSITRASLEVLSKHSLPPGETPLEVALSASQSLENDREYRAWCASQDFSDKSEYDCEEMLVGFLANYVSAQAAILKPGEKSTVTIVTGMFYEPSLPGKGGGHVWLRVIEPEQSFYIDPTSAIDSRKLTKIELEDGRFIPIAERPIVFEKSVGTLKMTLEAPILYRLPR